MAQPSDAAPAPQVVPPAMEEDEATRQKRISDLVARNEAPVKLAFLRRNDGAAASAQAAAAGPSGAGGAQQEEKPKGKKDKKGQKGGNGRGKEVCINHFLGTCTYGDKCRFSHDVQAYLATRPTDLPGTCPFINTGTCPYGIACRFAGTHTSTDELHTVLRAHILKQQEQQQQGAAAAASAGADAGAPGDAGAMAAVPEQPAVTATAAPEQAAVPVVAAGGVLQGPVLLPVPESVQQPFNSMGKDLQRLLWKNRYDFTKADGVLKDLGLKVSMRPAKPLPEEKRQGKDGNNRQPQGQKQQQDQQQQSGKKGGDAGSSAAPQVGTSNGHAAPPAVASGQEAAGAEAMETEAMTVAAAVPAAAAAAGQASEQQQEAAKEEGGEPERKRARLEEGSSVAAAGGAAGVPAAAVAAAEVVAAAAAATATADKQDLVAQHVEVPLRREEKRVIDFRGKTVLAPLTTVGNLPFRRVCKKLGADVTVGEMALATNLLQGQASEWALLKRHPCEDLFGVQIAGGFPDTVARACQLIDEACTSVDYVDINMGCPIDIVCDRGAGSALLLRPKRIAEIARAADRAMSLPLTLKTRKGYHDDQDVTHTFVDQIRSWGPIALTLHGRTRQQRYSKTADWSYIQRCAEVAQPTGLQLIGNGDVFSYADWQEHVGDGNGALSSCMIGRGALIKPWLFTEIKEQRHWDISATERFDLLRDFSSAGLTHWGSDGRGVETTRRFLLEWLSYMHRYIPVGLLEVVPQKLQWRQPRVYGRNDLETLLCSDNPGDWIHISEMLLGRAPEGFTFTPKHKSTSYAPPSATAGGQPGAVAAAAEEDMAEG